MGEQNRYKDKVMLYRYIVSYMSILIVPIIILVLGFKYIGFKTLEGELFKKDIATLKAATYNLEKVLDTCRSIAMQITHRYTPFELNLDIISAQELIQSLEQYNIVNDTYEDIFVIFHEASYSYSSTSSMKTVDFYNKYHPKDLTGEAYKKMLRNIKQPTLIRNVTYEGEDYTLYTFPYFQRGEVIGNVIFKIKTDHLNDVLGVESKEIKRMDYLVTKQELEACYKVINKQFELNMGTEEIRKDIGQLLDKNNLIEGKAYIIKSIQGNSLFISYMPEFNTAYISVTSNTEVLKSLSLLKITIFSIMGIILIVGTGFAIWIAQNNYRPIQQLKYLTKPYLIKINEENYKDEMDLIKQTIGYLSKQNEKLEYEFEKNIPIKQTFLLNQLINGTIGDKEIFYQECIDVGIGLAAPYHSILLVKGNQEASSELEILSLIQKYMKDIMQIHYAYVIQILKNNIFTLLIGTSKQYDIDKHLVERQHLKIAIGTIESDIYHMPNAYIRARSIFELSETKNENFIVWDQIEEYIETNKNMVNDLKVYAKNRQLEHLKVSVKEMIHTIKEMKIPLEVVRDSYCEVMIILNKYLISSTYNMRCEPVDLMILYDIKEKETLTEIFLETFNEVIKQVEQANKKIIIKLDIEKIKQFIEMSYNRTEFSVQLVADEFNTSISYLSQYFKEHMQMTILDYITLLRIEKAKKLMETSSESIQGISEQVGYINVSSFIRRFKQVTGKTPGEYRKCFKEVI